MKRVVYTVLLAVLVVLPVVARADTIDLTNQFGSVTILASGISSFGSQLRSVDVNGQNIGSGHAMGSVFFSTGAFISTGVGSTIWTGGEFSSVGSTFIVTGKWGPAKADKGTIFSGAFTGPIDWTLIAGGKFFHEYELTGTIQGQLWNGHMATGTTTQTIYTYWNQEAHDHKGSIHLGATAINSTPEPGTLGLLGSGLLAMAGAFRRKISAVV